MAEQQPTPDGNGSHVRVAFDLMKTVQHHDSRKHHEWTEEAILSLYRRCLAATWGRTKTD